MLFTKAAFVAILSICSVMVEAVPVLQTRAVDKTSAPAGAIIVRKSGTKAGEYATISAAVATLGKGKTAQIIFIYPGTYNEQVTLEYQGPLTIQGYTSDGSSYNNNQVVISKGIASSVTGSLDTSGVVRAHGDNLSMYNINMVNTYGKGSPALAIVAGGDKQAYYGCSFIGFQDTILAAVDRQFYKKCYIEGATDYIFGAASAWFEDCTIASSAPGYVTAMGRTDNKSPAWYVISNSLITSTPSFSNPAGQVYLGRPWKEFARVIYQGSTLTNVVNTKGWTTMFQGAKPTFEEYQNKGAGSNMSARLYETKASGAITMSFLLGADYKTWVDQSF